MAVLLTWLLFLFWSVIGLAVLKLGRHRWSVSTLLLAPTVGFATLTVNTYILIRLGLPAKHTAVPVGTTLFLAALGLLWRTRPTAALGRRLWTRSRAFVAALVCAFGLVGWPMFQYGFDWVANGNDDMANYCLIASGYRDHGYNHVPELADVSARGARDQSYAFFSFILLEVRPGSELLVASVSTWTCATAQQVFMPTLIALHLSLIAAAGGLAVATWRRRRAGVLAVTLLAVSAATSYGVIHQLIGQVSGLALLCASLALVTARCRRLSGAVLARRAGACGVAFAGQIVFYPEVTPVLVGACVLLGLRDLLRRRLDRRHLAHAAGAIAVMGAMLPLYLYGCATFIVQQQRQGSKTELWLKELFPHALTPRGPAMAWGVLPVAGPESLAFQNFGIVLGLVLLGAMVVPTVVGLRRGRADAAALAVAGALGASLFVNGAAFGLFKVIMFAQPFLWAAVAGWVVSRRSVAAFAAAGMVLCGVAGLNARVQYWYLDQSRGREQRVDLPVVSARKSLTAFRAEYAHRTAAGAVDQVLVATHNLVLQKLLAAEVRGRPTGYLGVNPFNNMLMDLPSISQRSPLLSHRAEWRGPLGALNAGYGEAFGAGGPTIRDPRTGELLHRVISAEPDRPADPTRALVVATTGGLSVLNRHRYPETGTAVLCVPLPEVSNFAVFTHATGARQHFLGKSTPAEIAYHAIEADNVFRKRTMAGVGHAMVLDVLNPSPQVRVLMNYTASSKQDPLARNLAPVKVVGDRCVAVGAVGSGSARLVSPPLATQAAGAGHYLALDFGHPVRNANRLAAAERLWGAELPRDRRMLTGHLRDLSVLSEEEYAAFRPPQQISKFPDDLAHPHLEYSGLYEEGWVGKEFKLRLTQPEPGHEVVLRGMVPGIPGAYGFHTEIVVRVDGAPVLKRTLGPGKFELRAPAGTAPTGAAVGPRWVEVRFSDDQELPAPDGRRAVAHLKSVGFEPQGERSRPPERLTKFPDDLDHPMLEHAGISLDGWCAGAFAALVWQTGPGADAVVRGMIPEVAGTPDHRTEVTLVLDGAEVAKKQVGTGEFELRAPGGPSVRARRIECRFSNTLTLPPPDGRAVGAHLRFVGFEPAR
ncbi:MAG: hypothetical protein ACKODX_14850 [Gemmata sp.]